MHCAERGELLDRVRRWYELELERLNNMLRMARDRERKMQEKLHTVRDGISTPGQDPGMAISSQVR